MVAVGAIKNHSISNSFPQIFLSLTDRVHWKAVAVIAVVSLLFAAVVYNFIKSRVSPTPPPPATTPTNSLLAQPLTVRDVRKKICLKKIEALLEPGQKLGEAVDSGDCFYDALSQALERIGIHVSQQQLRQDIAQALKDSTIAQKIQLHFEKDPNCMGGFEDYKKYVCYSENELTQLRSTDSEAPSSPYWGVEKREGLILCNKYQFNLRILSASILDDEFSSDETLKDYQCLKENFEASGDEDGVKMYEEMTKNRLIVLSRDESQYSTGDETYPPNAPYAKTCTLVLYENHFRPVLNS